MGQFQELLVERLRERKMTQAQLATVMGVAQQTVSKWVAGTSIPRTDADVVASMKSLNFDGVIVVTLGGEGAMAVRGGDVIARATPPRVAVVDTVGAGDAFCAGFCDALARGLALPDVITWATACGALAATKHGAQPSMPTADAVEAVLST